jgi:DNA-directed RNA polymerase subunit RPC12/RpoP
MKATRMQTANECPNCGERLDRCREPLKLFGREVKECGAIFCPDCGYIDAGDCPIEADDCPAKI